MAKEYKHTTRDRKTIALKDLEFGHLVNILNFIERKAKEGLLIQYGGGMDADDIWYDEEMIYGDEVLEKMNYSHYIAEYDRRQLLRNADLSRLDFPGKPRTHYKVFLNAGSEYEILVQKGAKVKVTYE